MHKCVVNSDGEVRLEGFPSQMHEQRARNTFPEMPSSCVDWNATLDNSEYSRTTFGPRQSALRSLYLRSHPSRTAFSFSSAVELYAATRLLVPTILYFFATVSTSFGSRRSSALVASTAGRRAIPDAGVPVWLGPSPGARVCISVAG